MAMLALNSACERFFEEVALQTQSCLLLDYDGTLAPFTVNRDRATPYPEIPQLLDRIVATDRTRVVVVSGRRAHEIAPLLGTRSPLEVWGSHGVERLLPDGSYCSAAFEPRQTVLASVDARLEDEGLRDLVEIKTGGVAVHWRGLPEPELLEVRSRAYRALRRFALIENCRLLDFDGGVELRIRSENKGHAVRAICAEVSEVSPIAYLGDDTTDEDAFQALRGRGLTVLVRPEHRETGAEVWLKPPDELLLFLAQWLSACGGDA